MVTKKEASDAAKNAKLDPNLIEDWISGKSNPVEHVQDDNGIWHTREIKLTKADRRFAKKIQKQIQDLLDM